MFFWLNYMYVYGVYDYRDTAGQERYDTITTQYFRRAQVNFDNLFRLVKKLVKRLLMSRFMFSESRINDVNMSSRLNTINTNLWNFFNDFSLQRFNLPFYLKFTNCTNFLTLYTIVHNSQIQ